MKVISKIKFHSHVHFTQLPTHIGHIKIKVEMELKLEKCNQMKIDNSNISILKDLTKYGNWFSSNQ